MIDNKSTTIKNESKSLEALSKIKEIVSNELIEDWKTNELSKQELLEKLNEILEGDK